MKEYNKSLISTIFVFISAFIVYKFNLENIVFTLFAYMGIFAIIYIILDVCFQSIEEDKKE